MTNSRFFSQIYAFGESLCSFSTRKRPKKIQRAGLSTPNVNRTRRLASSSSSSAENDEPSPSPVEHERSDAYKLRPKKPEVELKEDLPSEDDRDSPPVESKPRFDESIRELLWKPKLDLPGDTTITEVTDHTGVTVLIREVSETRSLATPRFLGYGHAGRGVRH